jgi:hypothetical protein
MSKPVHSTKGWSAEGLNAKKPDNCIAVHVYYVKIRRLHKQEMFPVLQNQVYAVS